MLSLKMMFPINSLQIVKDYFTSLSFCHCPSYNSAVLFSKIITSGYDNKDFTPHNSAKLIFPEVEIFKKLKLIEDYKTVSNVLWSIDRISSLRDGTIMIIRPTLRNANQPLYIHSTNWTIHNGYPATNENLITNETERAYILDRLLQYKKDCQFNYNRINHIIQSIKFE